MRRPAAALFAALAIVACENASTPVEPVWGKQACANCTMLVSDPRFAAELLADEGTRVFFDDPGCMASWLLEHPGRIRHAWVRSSAGTWIEARSTRYSRGQNSPMGFGFAPAESGDAAWSDVETEAGRRAAVERRAP